MSELGPLEQARDPENPRIVEKRNAGRVQRAARRNRVLALAAAGATNERIAEVLGMTPSGVSTIIINALERYSESDQQKVGMVRAQQLQRLDRMLVAIWSKVEEGNLKAIDRALRVEQMRARIAGTERPVEHDHQHTHRVEPMEIDTAEVARLEAAWKDAAIDGTAVELEPGPPPELSA